MKNWRKMTAVLLVLVMVFSMAACSGGGDTSIASNPTESTSTPESTAPASSDNSSEESPTSTANTGADMNSYPRQETLYVGGNQWGSPVANNPMASNPNYGAMAQSGVARVIVWETMYMYNIGDSKTYPLLADGDYQWNDDQTEITVKIKAAAKWSDGTALTANDVAATWDAHVKYQSNTGIAYQNYVASVTATDDSTVVITLNQDNLNRMKVLELLPKMYVMQKAYLEELDGKNGGDATKMKSETMWDAPVSGPYAPKEQNDQKWVVERNDNYWGQDASMWGKLPVPKYIIHNIYTSNDVSAQAFANGEIDMNQSYVANIQKMWEDQGLPISTYYSEAPYQAPGVLPVVLFNTQRPGLDQVAVRKAIAIATDFDKIATSAATGQTPSFQDYPSTLFNWSESQQSLIQDQDALSKLQWNAGKDIEGAKKLLDDAGVVDTNGDGNREYNGTELSFKVMCPDGWNDYQASLQIVQEAGKNIGIQIETYFPESAQWTDDMQSGNFDITLTSYEAGISTPWSTAYNLMYGFGGDFPDIMTTNQGRYYNEEADQLLLALSNEMDATKQKELYQKINEIWLSEVPSFCVFYRPVYWHNTYEGVWTNFPYDGDGSDPVIPAAICQDGYGIAALYNLKLVDEG